VTDRGKSARPSALSSSVVFGVFGLRLAGAGEKVGVAGRRREPASDAETKHGQKIAMKYEATSRDHKGARKNILKLSRTKNSTNDVRMFFFSSKIVIDRKL
jgi:hypothetical protein